MRKNIKIYSEGEASLKKYINRSFYLFSLLLPMAGALVFGASELITAYFSVLNDFSAGIIFTQIISIAGDVFTFVCLCLAYTYMASHEAAFGAHRTKGIFITGILSHVAVNAVSLMVLYTLVVLGWHDYSLSMFFDVAPLYLIEAGLSCLINALITIVIFVVFYLAPSLKSPFLKDGKFMRILTFVLAGLVLIKLVSLGTDIALYDGGYNSINNIVGGIIFPILYEVLEVGAAYFAVKFFLSKLTDRTEALGINF